MENTYKKRVRIEVSTSVKGIKTYSCTIEMIDTPAEEVLTESDELVVLLDNRYPAPLMEEKEVKKG